MEIIKRIRKFPAGVISIPHARHLVAASAIFLFWYLLIWFVRFATWTSPETFENWFSDWSLKVLIMNLVLFALITGWIFSVINRFRITAIVILLFLGILSLAHWMKMAVLGIVLYPWDLLLTGEAITTLCLDCLADYWINILLLVPFFAALFFLWKYLPKKGLRIWMRLPIFVVTTLMLMSLGSPRYSFLKPWSNRIIINHWQQNYCYERAGLVLAYASHIQNFWVEAPDGYSEERIRDILAPYETSRPDPGGPSNGSPSQGRPFNVIVIHSESFWDVRKLGSGVGPASVRFNQPGDPTPLVWEIEEKFGSIELVVPVFAGGSCNSEFELYTSSSMVFFPPGSMPYESYIRQAVPTLAAMLREAGYETLVIQATKESYFNDFEVYPRLGFKRFMNASEWKVPPTSQDENIDDSALINEIKAVLSSSNQPFLIHAATMENHWPYPKSRYEGLEISTGINMEGLEKYSVETLDTYVKGLKRFESALSDLITFLSEHEEIPTLVAFYGDHLPSLGSSSSSDNLYRRTGYFNDELVPGEQVLRKYAVQMFFWNNFGYSFKDRLPQGPISMNFAAPVLADIIGIDGGSYYQFLKELCRRYPVFSVQGCFDSSRDYFLTEELLNDQIVKDYGMLQWDRIFAEGYSNIR